MLKISDGQFNALQSASLDDFKARLHAHLTRVFPDRAPYPIEEGMAKANGYGLTSEIEVCKFLDLMVLYGVGFDLRDPWLEVFKTVRNRPVFERKLDEAYEAHLEQ